MFLYKILNSDMWRKNHVWTSAWQSQPSYLFLWSNRSEEWQIQQSATAHSKHSTENKNLSMELPGLSSNIVFRNRYSSFVTARLDIFSTSWRDTQSSSVGMPSRLDSISEHLKSSAYTIVPLYGMERYASLKHRMSNHVLCSRFIWSGKGSEMKPVNKKQSYKIPRIAVLGPWPKKTANCSICLISFGTVNAKYSTWITIYIALTPLRKFF